MKRARTTSYVSSPVRRPSIRVMIAEANVGRTFERAKLFGRVPAIALASNWAWLLEACTCFALTRAEDARVAAEKEWRAASVNLAS